MIAAAKYALSLLIWGVAIAGTIGLTALVFVSFADRFGWLTIPDHYSDEPDDAFLDHCDRVGVVDLDAELARLTGGER